MGRGAELVDRIYSRLDGVEWLGRLVVRLSVGLEFFGSGLGKLGKLPGFVEYFRSLGIPAPELQAPFVSSSSDGSCSPAPAPQASTLVFASHLRLGGQKLQHRGVERLRVVLGDHVRRLGDLHHAAAGDDLRHLLG